MVACWAGHWAVQKAGNWAATWVQYLAALWGRRWVAKWAAYSVEPTAVETGQKTAGLWVHSRAAAMGETKAGSRVSPRAVQTEPSWADTLVDWTVEPWGLRTETMLAVQMVESLAECSVHWWAEQTADVLDSLWAGWWAGCLAGQSDR